MTAQGMDMRIILPFLIVLGASYVWDTHYNNGILTDGAKSMLRDIEHSIR